LNEAQTSLFAGNSQDEVMRITACERALAEDALCANGCSGMLDLGLLSALKG